MKKLFEIVLIQENDIELENTCDGHLLISPTSQGWFNGDNMKGQLVPVGMGLTFSPKPGINDIRSSMLLSVDDGAKILMELDAYFDVDPETEERMSTGQHVDSTEYYYKGTASFRTGVDAYKWLERRVCVCDVYIESWQKLKLDIFMV